MNRLVTRPCQAYFLRARNIGLFPKKRGKIIPANHNYSRSLSSTENKDFRPSEELAKERYDSRVNEDIETKRSRLLYQSRKRGMLENGVILASFANKFLNELNAEQLDDYDRLINLPTNDWDIFYWATRTKPTPPEFETPIMDKLREHLKSKVSSSNNSVLGKTRPDDIVLPFTKKNYDLDVDVSQVSTTDYATELFDSRTKNIAGGKKKIVLMTEWRKQFFEKRLKRTLSSPTSMKPKESSLYTQKVASKNIACEDIKPMSIIDSHFEKSIKHHNFMQHLLGPELTDNAIDYDDEVEAWAEMLWHRNYGMDDSKISPSQLDCTICHSKLHCCDPGLDGYVPKEILSKLVGESRPNEQKCQRCRFSQTYNVQLTSKMPAQYYNEFLNELSNQPASVVCVLVDLTDFPGGIWEGLVDSIGSSHRILVVGNKLDLLPYDGSRMVERVKSSLVKSLSRLRPGNRNLHVRDVLVMSARTGFGIHSLVSRLLSMTNARRDIYLLGCENSGKSTLFSALLQSDLSAQRKGDIISRVSAYTIYKDVRNLKFPIDLAEGWEIELKRRHTERFERNTEAHERALGSTTKFRQAEMPHMSSLINRFEYPPLAGSKSLTEPNEAALESPRFTDDHPLSQIENLEPLSANEDNFKDHKFFHQTPSSCHHDQIHDLLTNEEKLEVFPNETIMPRKYSLRPLNTIFIAGLARLDLLTSQSTVMFTIFVSKYLPIHVVPTRNADQFYNNFLGSPYLGVPLGSNARLATWPGLSSSQTDFLIKGVSYHVGAADVVFSSIGWALVNLLPDNECVVRAFTPDGRGIFLRDPPLLAKANRDMGKKIRDTPVFRHPRYITLQKQSPI